MNNPIINDGIFACDLIPSDKMEVSVYSNGNVNIELTQRGGTLGSVNLHRDDVRELIGLLAAGLQQSAPKVQSAAPKAVPTLTPQARQVLRHLQRTGTISAVEAWDSYRVRSLPRRIADLRELGYDIKSEVKHHPITGQRYVRYSLTQAPALALQAAE